MTAPECTRSHPHELMDGYCQLRTEIARLTNENARLKAECDMYKKEPNLDTSEERVQEIDKRQHVTDGTRCWCEPVLDYVDPITGAEVWIHREPQ